MSTKTQIQTLISQNLASGSTIIATNHREVENELLDNLYGNEFSSTIENITSTFPILFGQETYGEISLIKQGRVVNIKGRLNMPFDTVAKMNINVTEFPELEPSGDNVVGIGISENDGSGVDFRVIGNQIKNLGNIFTNEVIIFNLTYNTLN